MMPTFVQMQEEGWLSTHINLHLVRGIKWTLDGEPSSAGNYYY